MSEDLTGPVPGADPRKGSVTLERVVLGELDPQGQVVRLTDAHAQALAAAGLVEACAERHGWRPKPPGRVGSVRIGDIQVEVRPKDKVKLTRLRSADARPTVGNH